MEPSSYQKDIVYSIFSKKHKEIAIKLPTQAGKTFGVCAAVVLYAIFNPNESIVLISHRKDQAKYMMNYVLEFFSRSKWAQSFLNYDIKGIMDRLQTERTKTFLRLKNKTTIRILSAEGQLLGYKASLLIVDEAAMIDDVVFRTEMVRMQGSVKSRNRVLVLISTPQRINFFHEEYYHPDTYRITADWQTAVAEGRLDHDFVMDRKKKLTADEFMMWYEAEFLPKADKYAFFETQELEHFVVPYEKMDIIEGNIEELAVGVDVAGEGNDRTVFTFGYHDKKEDMYKIIKYEEYTKLNTLQVANQLYKSIYRLPYNNLRIINVSIDTSGMGEGVYADFNQLMVDKKFTNRDVYVYNFKGSRRAVTFSDNCANAKAELLYKLGREVEKDKIRILRTRDSFREVRNVRMRESKGKLYVVDQNVKFDGMRMSDKSPDYFDSMLYCFNNMLTGQVDRRKLFKSAYGVDTW